MSLLEVHDLHAGYGPIEVLKGVSLRVDEGEIVAVIGANGAGKSSTLMAISGCLKPRRGDIRFAGQSIAKLAPHQIVRRGVIQSPEGRKIFPRLTVQENLLMGAYARSDRQAIEADLKRVLDIFPILAERRRQAGGTLSGGEQQMLAVGRALLSRPKLLLLDEPSLGLAPLVASKIFQVIRQLNREGMAILLVEQAARSALGLAHRGYVMETGEITMQDAAAELLKDRRVQQAYLGG